MPVRAQPNKSPKCITCTHLAPSPTATRGCSYTSTVDDKKTIKKFKGKFKDWDNEIFACINQDDRVNRMICEFYSCGNRTQELCQTINVAFQVCESEQ